MNRFLTDTLDCKISNDINLSNNNIESLTYIDRTIYDAFGKLRVSEEFSLIELSFIKDSNDTQTSKSIIGDGLITRVDSYLILQSNVGSTMVQTRQRGQYQPGKSLLILLTGVLNHESGNIGISRLGYFDDSEGIFFEYENGVAYIVKRKNAIDERHLISGFDPTKTQIYWIDLTWLGVGNVRCGVYIDGVMKILYTFKHANIELTPYMNYANLFIRASTDGSSKLLFNCGTVISEGGFNPLGKLRSIDNHISSINITNVLMTPLIALRVKNGINMLQLESFNIITTAANTSIHYELFILKDIDTNLLLNAVWESLNDTESYSEHSTINTMTLNISTLTPIISGYIGRNDSSVSLLTNRYNNLILSNNLSNVSDIAVLAAQSLSNAVDCYSQLLFKEL